MFGIRKKEEEFEAPGHWPTVYTLVEVDSPGSAEAANRPGWVWGESGKDPGIFIHIRNDGKVFPEPKIIVRVDYDHARPFVVERMFKPIPRNYSKGNSRSGTVEYIKGGEGSVDMDEWLKRLKEEGLGEEWISSPRDPAPEDRFSSVVVDWKDSLPNPRVVMTVDIPFEYHSQIVRQYEDYKAKVVGKHSSSVKQRLIKVFWDDFKLFCLKNGIPWIPSYRERGETRWTKKQQK